MSEFDAAARLRFGLKKRSRQLGLPDNASQRARGGADREVKRERLLRCLQSFLHDSVTPALARNDEPILFENATDLRARKNPEFTRPAPQPGL